MKNSIQITITVQDNDVRDEIIAQLSNIQFDGFEEKDTELLAFAEEVNFNEAALNEILSYYNVPYTKTVIEETNWNAYWESNFEPVVVEDFCEIRADFHPAQNRTVHEIVITPKMSFGTGHHSTTYMMIREMSRIHFKNKKVADFGTGTGVLAILSEKLGSTDILAIDYDDWSIENAAENVQRNGCNNIQLQKADHFNPEEKFDVILANINKNVLIDNASGLLFGLNEKGTLLLSGLLTGDEADILSVFLQPGIIHNYTVERNKWICISLQHNG